MKPEFLVCIKDDKKKIHTFKFPNRTAQTKFVAIVRKQLPGTDFIYTVEGNKRKQGSVKA